MTKQLFDAVKEFMTAGGEPKNLHHQDDKMLRVKLLQEELDEFAEARTQLDSLDALVDMAYLMIGACHQLGISFETLTEALSRVHKNNMGKVVGGKVMKRADGKIIKPEGFVPVDLSDLASNGKEYPDVGYCACNAYELSIEKPSRYPINSTLEKYGWTAYDNTDEDVQS